jgi:hypothetical protein
LPEGLYFNAISEAQSAAVGLNVLLDIKLGCMSTVLHETLTIGEFEKFGKMLADDVDPCPAIGMVQTYKTLIAEHVLESLAESERAQILKRIQAHQSDQFFAAVKHCSTIPRSDLKSM